MHTMGNEQFTEALANCPLFHGLHDALLRDILSADFAIERFLRGAFVARQGEPVQRIGVLLDGQIEQCYVLPSGRRYTIGRLERGALLGEDMLFLHGASYTLSMVTLADCAIIFIDKHTFLAMLSRYTPMLENYLALLNGRISVLAESEQDLAQASIRKRLALRILQLCAQQGNEQRITFPYSRREMAERMRIPRPSLSRELAHMQAKGWLSYAGHELVIHDLQAIEDCLVE